MGGPIVEKVTTPFDIRLPHCVSPGLLSVRSFHGLHRIFPVGHALARTELYLIPPHDTPVTHHKKRHIIRLADTIAESLDRCEHSIL